MLLSPAMGYEGQMPGYCENVRESAGVPYMRVVSPGSDKFATLLLPRAPYPGHGTVRRGSQVTAAA